MPGFLQLGSLIVQGKTNELRNPESEGKEGLLKTGAATKDARYVQLVRGKVRERASPAFAGARGLLLVCVAFIQAACSAPGGRSAQPLIA